MRVLCIEDQEYKYEAIAAVLASAFGASMTRAKAVAAGLGTLDQGWDLIILDMNFPSGGKVGREQGRQETAGIKVLQAMSAQNIQVPVIIATAHDSFGDNKEFKIKGIDELNAFLASAFPQIFKGVVRVDFATDEWHGELVALIRELGFGRED